MPKVEIYPPGVDIPFRGRQAAPPKPSYKGHFAAAAVLIAVACASGAAVLTIMDGDKPAGQPAGETALLKNVPHHTADDSRVLAALIETFANQNSGETIAYFGSNRDMALVKEHAIRVAKALGAKATVQIITDDKRHHIAARGEFTKEDACKIGGQFWFPKTAITHANCTPTAE